MLVYKYKCQEKIKKIICFLNLFLIRGIIYRGEMWSLKRIEDNKCGYGAKWRE